MFRGRLGLLGNVNLESCLAVFPVSTQLESLSQVGEEKLQPLGGQMTPSCILEKSLGLIRTRALDQTGANFLFPIGFWPVSDFSNTDRCNDFVLRCSRQCQASPPDM